MNKDIKRRWVEALRSGKYKKTTGQLHVAQSTHSQPSGYCCLGVLTALAIEDGVEVPADWPGLAGLPSPVKDWAGLDSRFPQVPFRHEALEADEIGLTALNDGDELDIRKRSFKEIADKIEKHL